MITSKKRDAIYAKRGISVFFIDYSTAQNIGVFIDTRARTLLSFYSEDCCEEGEKTAKIIH